MPTFGEVAPDEEPCLFIQVCRRLEQCPEVRAGGAMLLVYLADRLARIMAGDDLFRRGLLTEEDAREYQTCIEDRDAALRELGLDHDPLAGVVRAN
jgi:hypothetical protein